MNSKSETFSVFNNLDSSNNSSSNDFSLDSKIDKVNNNNKRNELIQKLRFKRDQIRENTNRIPKKVMKKTFDFVKEESKNKLINENILKYYTSLSSEYDKKAKKSKDLILKPSEIINRVDRHNSNKSGIDNKFNLTSEILELYYITKLNYDNMELPTPEEIDNNRIRYEQEYYQFIYKLLDKIKILSLDDKERELRNIISNSYCAYMTKCLNIDIDPLKLIK